MRKSVASPYRLILATLAVCVTPALAVETYFVGGIANWNDPNNWAQAGTDGLLNTGDDVHVKPTTADVATILGGQTATINTVESPLEIGVQHPANARDLAALPATARLNIEAGATLTLSGNNSFRVGRLLDNGQTAGTIRGEVVQTGGSVFLGTIAAGLRISAGESGTIADSFYQISGGSIRGATNAAGAVTGDLRIGTTTNIWGTAEFHVKGSGATEIAFADLQMAGNTSGNGTSILHFSIDAGGVTPITLADELQFRGTSSVYGSNLLQIDLLAAPPEADITLVNAARLNTNGGTSPSDPLAERFTGMPDLTPIIREFDGLRYTWLLTYKDTSGADPGARVYLDFVSAVAIPEPSSLACLGLGATGLLARRRRA